MIFEICFGSVLIAFDGEFHIDTGWAAPVLIPPAPANKSIPIIAFKHKTRNGATLSEGDPV